MSDSYWPLSGRWIFLCNKAPGAAFRFLLSSEGASSSEVGGMHYHVLYFFYKGGKNSSAGQNACQQVLDSISQHLPRFFREDCLPRRVLAVSKTCQSYRVLYNIFWLLQREPLLLTIVWWGLSCLHIWRQDVSDAGEARPDGLQRRRPYDHR